MSELSELIKSEKLTLVDIWAQWCGPCRMMNPVLAEISSEMSEFVNVVKIDADTNKDILNEYNIRGIPTFLLFKNGELVWRQAGAMEKRILEDRIKEFIN